MEDTAKPEYGKAVDLLTKATILLTCDYLGRCRLFSTNGGHSQPYPNGRDWPIPVRQILGGACEITAFRVG